MALPAAMFERYVNSKDNQTNAAEKNIITLFERYVNSKDNQTFIHTHCFYHLFERYVNSKDNQTLTTKMTFRRCLRDM